MIIKFGIWIIDKDGITCNVNDGYDYDIAKENLWITQEYAGHIVWHWLIHLTEKSWVKNINDLNSAFYFAQDYFKAYKPEGLDEVSTAQTLYIQQQLMNIRKKMKSIEEGQEDENVFSNEATNSLEKYILLKSEIKFL